MTDEGFTVFNDRELKLLKLYMGHHSWNDLITAFPNDDPMYSKDAEAPKKYGRLRKMCKMSDTEIDVFRSKLGI